MKKYFSNTPLSSWLKVFVSAIILQIMNGISDNHSLFSWDIIMIKKMLSAGLVSLLPVIYNYLNPNDTRYGVNKNKMYDNTKNQNDNLQNKKDVLGGFESIFVGPLPPPPPPPNTFIPLDTNKKP